MTQTSKMEIDQATIGTGAAGEAFTGGDLTDAGGGLANVVRITNTSPDTADTQVVLLWVPHDSSMVKLDTVGEANLFQESAHVWKFQPTAGSYDGSWQIRMREINAGVIQEEIRIFAVLSPKGIRTPALNEIADEDASLLFNGVVAIANSHENEGGNFSGWWRAYRKLLEEVEGGGLALTAEQGANFTAAVGNRVPWNTAEGTFTLTAPPTPSSGDQWGAFENVSDATVLTIAGNGNDIESPASGFSASFTVSQEDVNLVWIFNGTRWKLI